MAINFTVLINLYIFASIICIDSTSGNDANQRQFASGTRLFTASVYSELSANNQENILVSPFSVETVLALAQSGAKDETGVEIRSALHLPSSDEQTASLFETVLPTIESKEYALKTANRIYVENNFPVKEEFSVEARSVYRADFQNVDFAKNMDAASQINKWVSDATENKIYDLVNADDLDGDTKVILVNALYFKGDWSRPFYPTRSKKSKFFVNPNESVEVITINQESTRYNYYDSEELDAKYLELPFGGDASMVVVLPNKIEGIRTLEKYIHTLLVTPRWSEELVRVSLPKFKIESAIDFKSVLEKLGVHKAFTPGEADFSGISGTKGDLFIDKILQKTFIDVNELGVEAAAATQIGEPNSLPLEPTKTFVADHPFVFFIKVRDIVLFQGRVVNPKYE